MNIISKSKKSLTKIKTLFNISDNYFHETNENEVEIEENINEIEVEQNKNTFSTNPNVTINPNPPSPPQIINVDNNNPCQIVGGYMIGIPNVVLQASRKFRGRDLMKRKRRHCKWCKEHNLVSLYTCAGRGGHKYCKQRPQES